ncbi:telomere binding protein [Ascosphaera aggregata]|nr:telomere binding protein [Ascosphaera aggregata]
MDGLLTAVKTSRSSGTSDGVVLSTVRPAISDAQSHRDREVSSIASCMEVLKTGPTLDELYRILKLLDPAFSRDTETNFDIRAPGAHATQILQLLAFVVVPNFWTIVQENPRRNVGSDGTFNLKAALLRCFSSITGVSALVARLRTLISSAPSRKETTTIQSHIRDLISVLAAVLKPKEFVSDIFRYVNEDNGITQTQRHMLWQEFVTYIAGGKLLSATAQAIHDAKVDLPKPVSWAANGKEYASWLGLSIAQLATTIRITAEGYPTSFMDLLSRSLKLGYNSMVPRTCVLKRSMLTKLLEALVEQLLDGVLLQKLGISNLRIIVKQLRKHDQVSLFTTILRRLEVCYFSDVELAVDEADLGRRISGVAYLVSSIIEDNEHLTTKLRDWIAEGQIAQRVSMRRVLVTATPEQKSQSCDLINFLDLMNKSFASFGDTLLIKHTPSTQQDAIAEAVILAAARMSCAESSDLRLIMKSPVYLNAVSNRLAASSPRARSLGMLLGMTLSQLVETSDNALKFDLDESQQEELLHYRTLSRTKDTISEAEFRQLHAPLQTHNKAATASATTKQTLETNLQVTTPSQTKAVTIEKTMASNDEDEEFLPYEKPDSDPEDSDDDVTVVDRHKPQPPIYIRDLLDYLRDSENAPRYHAGITSASSLIRRKASFGSEVAEYMDALALTLVSLQDKYNLPGFYEHRLRAQIALLVSFPRVMGKYFVDMLFNGDISQDQRSTILIALGLSTRELAGFNDSCKLAEDPPASRADFPSKRLSEQMESVYANGDATMTALAKNVAEMALQPLADEATESLTGPKVLKTRVFSSRMDVEAKRKRREEQRKKLIPQDIHRILSEVFYLPLIGNINVVLHGRSRNASSPFLASDILRLIFQTATVMLSTLGPYAPRLIELLHEAIALIIALHTSPLAAEPGVLPAMLVFLMTVLELAAISGSTCEEQMTMTYSSEMVELRDWVNLVFGQAPGETDAKPMAAGILVKLEEMMQRVQARLLGLNSGLRY